MHIDKLHVAPESKSWKSPAAAVRTREYRLTRRALVRKFIGQKPTLREARALDQCALLLTRAAFGAVDPECSADMLVKLNAAARHAHRLLKEIAAERAPAVPAPPLRELVSRAQQQTLRTCFARYATSAVAWTA
jgi:hypothetical protein